MSPTRRLKGGGGGEPPPLSDWREEALALLATPLIFFPNFVR